MTQMEAFCNSCDLEKQNAQKLLESEREKGLQMDK
jgi:hypothetical protein